MSGPPVWDSFDEMAQAAIAVTRCAPCWACAAAPRHNARRLPDGRWTWRYDLFGPWPEGDREWVDFTPLWDDVSAIEAPVLFVKGGESRYVREEDIAELRRRSPPYGWRSWPAPARRAERPAA